MVFYMSGFSQRLGAQPDDETVEPAPAFNCSRSRRTFRGVLDLLLDTVVVIERLKSALSAEFARMAQATSEPGMSKTSEHHSATPNAFGDVGR